VEEVPDEQWVTFMLNKAEALLHLGSDEEAIKLLHLIEQRVKNDPAADPALIALIYQKLGHAYYQAPNPLESYTNYMRAYMISAHQNEYSPLTSRITMDLARVGERMGGTKALADQLFELGVRSQEAGELTRACTYLEQANAMYKAHNMVAMGNEMKQAYQALLRKQRHPEQAIQELTFTAKRLEKAGDLKQLANTYAQKADLHLNLMQTEEAKQDLLQAHAICDDELAATDPRVTLVYHVWARYCLLAGEFEEAVTYGRMAARFYGEMNFYQQAAESMMFVAEAFRRLGMDEEAALAEGEAERLRNRKLPPML
jgi:tetratricopeptide (TPR) repeat protein